MKRFIILITAILSAAGLVLAALYIYVRGRAQNLNLNDTAANEYERHYVFISSLQSQLTEDIFDDAAGKCEASGAYLEWCRMDVPDRLTSSECVDIALAMDADGIILYPDADTDLSEAIGSAAGNGIPVVTILRDVPDSGRISYIGVSSYQMGEVYGGWLLSLMDEGVNTVCLLEDVGDSESEVQLLYSQMVQAVRNGAPDGEELELVTRSVDSAEDFDAEEVIRGILLGTDRPDILICRNSVQTECAVQALIDYNLVESVDVIGYYTAEATLSAIRQELIPVTMTIDTEAIGDYCARALDEYIQLGRTSSYYNIPMESLTSMNIDRYVSEARTDGEAQP